MNYATERLLAAAKAALAYHDEARPYVKHEPEQAEAAREELEQALFYFEHHGAGKAMNADSLFDLFTVAAVDARQDGDEEAAEEIERALDTLNPFAAGYICSAAFEAGKAQLAEAA